MIEYFGKQKFTKNVEGMHNILDTIDICKTLHLMSAECKIFSRAHGILTKRAHAGPQNEPGYISKDGNHKYFVL